jgi:hypothetical protein
LSEAQRKNIGIDPVAAPYPSPGRLWRDGSLPSTVAVLAAAIAETPRGPDEQQLQPGMRLIYPSVVAKSLYEHYTPRAARTLAPLVGDHLKQLAAHGSLALFSDDGAEPCYVANAQAAGGLITGNLR